VCEFEENLNTLVVIGEPIEYDNIGVLHVVQNEQLSAELFVELEFAICLELDHFASDVRTYLGLCNFKDTALLSLAQCLNTFHLGGHKELQCRFDFGVWCCKRGIRY